jgi:hypothetical protein
MSSFFITFKSKSNKNKKKIKNKARPKQLSQQKKGHTSMAPRGQALFFPFMLFPPYFFKKNNKNK